MVYSSLNLLRFIRPSLAGSESTEKWRHFRGARHLAQLLSFSAPGQAKAPRLGAMGAVQLSVDAGTRNRRCQYIAVSI
jgi:hypothetical protein